MPSPARPCGHCARLLHLKSRGLCHRCYGDPAVRAAHRPAKGGRPPTDSCNTGKPLFGYAARKAHACKGCGEHAEPFAPGYCWRCCHDGTRVLCLARFHGGRLTPYELRVLAGMGECSSGDCEAALDALAARGLGRWADLIQPSGQLGRTLVLTREARTGVAGGR